jgi:hypothetical protein
MSVVVLDGMGFPLERRQASPPPLSPAEPAANSQQTETAVSSVSEQPAQLPSADESAERLARERIAHAVQARQQLRATRGPIDALERNRLAIVAAQQELGRILIARYCP